MQKENVYFGSIKKSFTHLPLFYMLLLVYKNFITQESFNAPK